MARGRISVVGNRVRLAGPSTAELPLDDATRELFRGWAKSYRELARCHAEASSFLGVGQEMFVWLDTGGWATVWADEPGARELQVTSSAASADDEVLLLSLPWEVLATGRGFLAVDGIQLFQVERRIGSVTAARQPGYRDLSLLFMAAEPISGGSRLQYEAEEAGILRATERLPLGLTVEETGCVRFLGERISLQGPFDALHLSCHGGLTPAGPVLALEDETGRQELIDPETLATSLGQVPPGLVFLSACQTAESPEDGVTDSFSRSLVRLVPSVLGWDGSVIDGDAIGFANVFYENLAKYHTPSFAAGTARRALLKQHQKDRHLGRDWHLARLWLGPQGGGSLCVKGKPQRMLAKDQGTRAFLDAKGHRVPVAGADRFVGRRREVQKALRVFRDDQCPGVIVHGMGNLGKSSLAARITSRCSDLTPVVVVNAYDPEAVFQQLCEALEPVDRQPWHDRWTKHIHAAPHLLADAVEDLLSGPFRDRPVLVIVDDLEQILTPPTASQELATITADYSQRAAITGLLRAFERARHDSRLLFTSRFDFTAIGTRGNDVAANLARVSLTPFDVSQQRLQWRASNNHQTTALDHDDLLARALTVAAGNPGLQDVLTTPLRAGELAVAETAIVVIERYLGSGDVPDAPPGAVSKFFTRMAFETYAAALTDDEHHLLTAIDAISVDPALLTPAGLAPIPLPEDATLAAGEVVGLVHPRLALTRLIGLGLLDQYQEEVVGAGRDGVAINPLTRPLISSLDNKTCQQIARAVLPCLRAQWLDENTGWPRDPRSILTTQVAISANQPTDAQAAALASLNLLHDDLHTAAASDLALHLGSAASSIADPQVEDHLDLVLVRRTAEAARQLGDAQREKVLLARGLSANTTNDAHRAQLRVTEADRLAQRGQPEAALTHLEEALPIFQQQGDIRSAAITQSKIADIHEARGNPDQALALHQQALPVFQQLGDIREAAVTQGQIADIHRSRGNLDQALALHQQALPVFQQLGDIRSAAITQSKIADIHEARGNPDQALALHQQALPVFQQLGDIREAAVTQGQIADIHRSRGNLDHALALHQQRLPIFERLGDVRSAAITHGKIADIHEARGNPDQALALHQQALPVFQQLGDIREVAITQGQIADIHEARGNLDQALALHQQALPVFQQLGDIRSAAITQGKIADIHRSRGNPDQALALHQQTLPVFQQLGDIREVAITHGKIADIHRARGNLDQALALHQQALPVFQQLGDIREAAVTHGKIADIHRSRGNPDQALALHQQRLPVFQQLGDIRSAAITHGKIADIHEARGNLDQALRIRLEQELPVYDKIGDIVSATATRFKIAMGAMQLNHIDPDVLDGVLTHCFEQFLELQIPDGITTTGFHLAQVRAARGGHASATEILDIVEAIFTTLGDETGLARCRELRRSWETE